MTKISQLSQYSEGCVETVYLFEDAAFEKCIRATRFNLTNLAVPRYHQVKNLILIACAEDDWDEPEECRLEVERIWRALHEVVPDSDA